MPATAAKYCLGFPHLRMTGRGRLGYSGTVAVAIPTSVILLYRKRENHNSLTPDDARLSSHRGGVCLSGRRSDSDATISTAGVLLEDLGVADRLFHPIPKILGCWQGGRPPCRELHTPIRHRPQSATPPCPLLPPGPCHYIISRLAQAGLGRRYDLIAVACNSLLRTP